jgi:hypothetical protein
MVNRILSRRVWPIGLLMACLLVEASRLGVGIDDLDEGYFVQQATRVLHGQLPYRDFDTLYTPGLALLHAGTFAISNGPSLIAPRSIAWLARAATVLLLFFMARPLARNWWWAILPGLILLVGLDNAPERWEPHPGWLSSLFAILAVWCLSHQSKGWLLASGAAAALAYLFKQNTGVFIVAAILLCAWPRSGWPAAAFAVATGAWLIPLLLSGVQVTMLGAIVGAVNQAGLFSAPEPTILIPIAALLGGLWLMRRDSHPNIRLYLVCGVALLLTEFPRMDTLHLLWSTPLLLILGAAALERMPRGVAIVSLGATALLVWPNLSARLTYVRLPMASVDGVSAPVETAADIRSAVEDIRSRTRAAEPIFVYPSSPLLYVLADRPNPTRFDHLNPGAASPTDVQGVIATLQRADVRLVVISDFWEAAWGPPGPNVPLEDWLASHYVEVARDGPYRILAAGL